MITETGLLHEFNLISKSCCSKLTGSSCQWDPQEEKFKMSKKPLGIIAMVVGYNAIAVSIQVIYTLNTARSSENEVNTKALSIMVFLSVGMLYLAFFPLKVFLESDAMEDFINEMAKFEISHVKHERNSWKETLKTRNMTRLAILTMKITRISAAKFTPPLVACCAVLMSDSPINLLTYFPSRAVLLLATTYGGVTLGKVVVFLWNLGTWLFVSKCWCIMAALIVTGCTGLSTAVLIMQRNFLLVRHGRDKDSSFVIIHKQINILVEMFNKLMSTALVFLLIQLLSAQIISGINLMGKSEISEVLFMSIIFLNGTMGINLVFGFCANVHETSNKCLKLMRTNVPMMSYSKVRNYKRMVRTLRVVKIHFGGMNFIEKLTPAIYQDFANEALVSCLLLTK